MRSKMKVLLAALAAKPIILGCPLSTAFLYGWDAERGIKLAGEEINAAGGVQVGGVKRPFRVEVIDTRDLEAGLTGARGGWMVRQDPQPGVSHG
jgi:ABC-type branched-subunit amino acid transport system substrate-binding protein